MQVKEIEPIEAETALYPNWEEEKTGNERKTEALSCLSLVCNAYQSYSFCLTQNPIHILI